jgi:cation transport regulator
LRIRTTGAENKEELMRYEKKSDLPDTIRDVLPHEAQELYLEAYQKSYDNYKAPEGGELSQESVAHRDGWTAVQQEYEQDKETGEWHRKGEESSETGDEEGKGVIDKLKDLV